MQTLFSKALAKGPWLIEYESYLVEAFACFRLALVGELHTLVLRDSFSLFARPLR